jgi:hypothetical protein
MKPKEIIVSLECPKCHFPARAHVEKFHKFIIYVCPKCQSNVVFYDNKIDIISDKMVKSLKRSKKLRFCGNALFPPLDAEKVPPAPPCQSGGGITDDGIVNLKILLETEKDFNKFLASL